MFLVFISLLVDSIQICYDVINIKAIRKKISSWIILIKRGPNKRPWRIPEWKNHRDLPSWGAWTYFSHILFTIPTNWSIFMSIRTLALAFVYKIIFEDIIIFYVTISFLSSNSRIATKLVLKDF